MTRTCTECGNPLPDGAPPSQKTCSGRCRSARSRRVRRARQRGSNAPAGGQREEWAVYDPEQHELAQQVASEELRPYVREQITEDVIQAIGSMMGLSAKAVRTIERDLDDPDPQIRMKAATLVARYTMSDRLIPELPKPALRVDLSGVPVPQHDEAAPEPEVPPAPGTRRCYSCDEERDEDEFESGAPRCRRCQAALKGVLLGAGDTA